MRLVPLFAVAALLLGSCSGGPLAPLRGFVGSWSGTHRLLGEETGHPASYQVREEGEALVWEFRSEWGGGFTGRGVQRWDAEAGEFVETWSDSQAPEEEWRTRGSWDAASATLTMRGEGEDWESGARIPFTHRTVRVGADAWRYVMIAERAAGPVEVMWIEMRRD